MHCYLLYLGVKIEHLRPYLLVEIQILYECAKTQREGEVAT